MKITALSPQRRTLIKEEEWPLFGSWYFRPKRCIDSWLDEEIPEDWNLGAIPNFVNVKSRKDFLGDWHIKELYRPNQRIAHHCKDGRIRAGSNVRLFPLKNGEARLYGTCVRCNNEKVDEQILFFLKMEDLDI